MATSYLFEISLDKGLRRKRLKLLLDIDLFEKNEIFGFVL